MDGKALLTLISKGGVEVFNLLTSKIGRERLK